MQVTVYKSTDGQFFETFDAFKAHEEAFLVRKGLSDVSLNASCAEAKDDGTIVIPVNMMPKFIADNAAALRKVLNEAVVNQRKPRGPNKPKAEVVA